jgi:hypothetical protein
MVMVNYLDFGRIEQLSSRDGESGMIGNQIIKLQEETGEVGAAYLACVGAENASASSTGKDRPDLALIEEVLDTMIVAADIINALTTDEMSEEVRELAERKLTKWESKLNNAEARRKQEDLKEFIK